MAEKTLLSGVSVTGKSQAVSAKGTKTFVAELEGSGAVAATIKIFVCGYSSNSGGLLVGTFVLSGTDRDSFTYTSEDGADIYPLEYVYCECTAISGTGALLNVSVLTAN